MAPQNEGNEESRNQKVEGSNQQDGSSISASADLESPQQQIEPFTDADPFRAARTRETIGETESILAEVQSKAVGFNDLADFELANLYKDATERAKWEPARQDAFIGILRLGKPVPPRAKRVL